MKILLDTGFMVGMFKPKDQHAPVVRRILGADHSANQFHTVWECIAEACHHLENRHRQALLRWLDNEGVQVHHGEREDLIRMADYMAKYANVSNGKGPDVADIALVLLADRINTISIFTVDEKDFSTYRTLSGKPFRRLWVAS